MSVSDDAVRIKCEIRDIVLSSIAGTVNKVAAINDILRYAEKCKGVLEAEDG